MRFPVDAPDVLEEYIINVYIPQRFFVYCATHYCGATCFSNLIFTHHKIIQLKNIDNPKHFLLPVAWEKYK